jgi:hypothetical protein
VAATALRLTFSDEQAQRVLLDALRILKAGAEGPMQPFFRRAAARYLGFIRRRFVNASRGDGTWPDLALSTKLNRLRRMHGGRLATSAKLNAKDAEGLSSGQKAKRGRFDRFLKRAGGKSRAEQLTNLAKSTKFAILRDTSTLFGALTEGQPGNEIDYSKDGVTIGVNVFYARFHQNPPIPGRPPMREILVQPDATTEEAMAIELANAILAAYGEAPEQTGDVSGG